MKLTSAFWALSQKDFKKTEILMHKPLIWFGPDVSRIQKSTKYSIELWVNTADEADLQTYKYPYLVSEDRTVKDLLLWKNQVEEVIGKKPIKTSEAKFSMVRNILDGAARNRWDTIVERETKRPLLNTWGVEMEAKGETKVTFSVTCELFMRSRFKPTSRVLTIQRNYLQHNICFPSKVGVTLEEFFNKILNINSKWREIPTPLGYSGNKYFSDMELKFLILCALPHYCTLQVHKSRRTLDQFTLESLHKFQNVCLMQKKKRKFGKPKEDPQKGGQNRENEELQSRGRKPQKEGMVFLLALQSKKLFIKSVLVTQ